MLWHAQMSAEAWLHSPGAGGGPMFHSGGPFVRPPDLPKVAGGLPPGMSPSQLSPNQLAYANAQVQHSLEPIAHLPISAPVRVVCSMTLNRA